MKKILFLLLVGSLLWSCSDDDLMIISETEEDNHASDTVVIEMPIDTICALDSLDFEIPIDTTNISEVIDTIEIRVSNVSEYTFEHITVQNHDQIIAYGNLAPGEFSEYYIFKYAWSLAAIQLIIDCAIYTIQPIDGLGSVQLTAGKYTYQVDADDSEVKYSRLQFTFIEDE